MTRLEYANKYGSVAVEASKGTTLFPSLFIAQAILESSDRNGNVANSTLAKKYNNHFGVKADKSWKGKVVSLQTGEVYNGQNVVITDGFRVYDTPLDSFKDRVKFLQQNQRYAKAGVFTAKTPFAQAQALQKAGYATAPNYAAVLSSIIKTGNLTELDKKKLLLESA